MSKDTHHCLNCGRSEREAPLIAILYAEDQSWICAQCLPILIHKPHQLKDKLKGSEHFAPAPHDHQD